MAKLTIFVIFTFVLGANSLSCDCDYKNRDKYCGPAPTCPSTVVLDPCGCCMICSKIEGEDCGGPWKIYGKCAPGLECQKSSSSTDYVGAGGIFGNHREPKGVCRKPGEVIQRTQPCFIAQKSYQNIKYSGHRGKRQVSLGLESLSRLPLTAQQTTTYASPSPPANQNILKSTILQALSTVSADSSMQTSPELTTTSESSAVTTDVQTTSQFETTTRYTTDNQQSTAFVEMTSEYFTTEQQTESVTTDTVTATEDLTMTNSVEPETTSIMTTDFMTTTVQTTTPCPVKPRCTPEGWFAPAQCDPCTRECWCVYINGNEIPNTRKQGGVHC